jgi:hypothetical protein
VIIITNEYYEQHNRQRSQMMAVFRFPVRAETSLLAWTFRPALGPNQPLSKNILAIVSLGIKQTERDNDHFPPPNTKV